MTTADKRLPAAVDAQPPVRAAAALRPVIRRYRDEIERMGGRVLLNMDPGPRLR